MKSFDRLDRHQVESQRDKHLCQRRVSTVDVNFLALLLVLGVALVGIFILQQYLPNSIPISVTALISLGFGCAVYLAHGAGRVTVLGLFNLALAMFVGLGGFAAQTQTATRVSDEWLLYAIVLATGAQGIATAICWRSVVPLNEALLPSPNSVCRHSFVVGLVMMLSVVVAQRSGIEFALGYLGEGIGFVGAMLIICAAFLHPSAKIVSLPTLAAFCSLAAYAIEIHQGTGRLRIVALVCAFLMVGSARFPRRSLKASSLLAVPLALWWLGQDRLNFQESTEQGSSEGRTGLESMFSPITTLAQVLEAQASGWPLEWGRTFLSIPFIIIPDSVVSNPPPAIGYDLVRLTEPSRVGTGFSEASIVFGEGVWNFGTWGLLLMLPIIVVLVRWLDRGFERAISRPEPSGHRRLMLVAIWASLGGTIADLAWSGFHTFATRILTRGPALLVLYPFFRPAPAHKLLPRRTRPVRNRNDRSVADRSYPPGRRPAWAGSAIPSPGQPVLGMNRKMVELWSLSIVACATVAALFFAYETHTASQPGLDNAASVPSSWDDPRANGRDSQPAATDGAALVDRGSFPGDPDPFRPTLAEVKSDLPAIYEDDCHVDQNSAKPRACSLFDSGADAPTVALVGDSHAAQWSEALRIVARDEGWNALSFTKSACGVNTSPTTQPGGSTPYTSCTEWNEKLPDALADEDVDLILTSNSTYDSSYTPEGQPLTGDEGLQAAVAGQREARAKLAEIAPLVEILDLPTPGAQLDCLKDNDARECSISQNEAAQGRNRVQKLALSELPEVETMDFTKYVCQDGACPAVVNGVVTFRDSNHITAAYSRTLAKPLENALRENTADTIW